MHQAVQDMDVYVECSMHRSFDNSACGIIDDEYEYKKQKTRHFKDQALSESFALAAIQSSSSWNSGPTIYPFSSVYPVNQPKSIDTDYRLTREMMFQLPINRDHFHYDSFILPCQSPSSYPRQQIDRSHLRVLVLVRIPFRDRESPL